MRENESFFRSRLEQQSKNVVLDLNTISLDLPHIHYNDSRILIDTGSKYNFIKPQMVSPQTKIIDCDYKIRTPAGESNGKGCVNINVKNMLGVDKDEKFYVYDFSDNYDVLIGKQTLQGLKAKIDLETNCLITKDCTIPLLGMNHIEINKGWNELKIKTNVCTPSDKLCVVSIKELQLYNIVTDIDRNGFIEIEYFSDCDKTLSIETVSVEECELYMGEMIDNPLSIDEITSLLRTEHMNSEEKECIISTLMKYPEIIKFEGDILTATNLLKHKIVTTDEEPVYSKNYRYPISFRQDISNEINKLLEQKIIRPSNSPYNSPLWVVPKKPDASGKRKVRLVVDYRKLNNKTKDDRFPLPNIEDLFSKIGRATYFSAIDLVSGFHQIEMEPESIPKTAFSTENGHYEFLRMPFGLKNGPPQFQRTMNLIFCDLPNVLVYLDDIIIFSDSLQEHMKHLNVVFKRLKTHQLKIQLDKTEFFKKELLFLGHIVSEKGIQPNPEKVKAIKDFPVPQTTKQIKQFLGLAGYYRKMIKGFAKIAQPLTNALRKTSTINPKDPKFIEAVNFLKEAITNAPILQLPKLNDPYILTTDASNVSLGAVLSQMTDNKDLPISFASRTLNPAEQNLSTIEKEMLAITWAVKHFRPYLYGRKFTLRTDHKPLQWLHSLKEPNAKLMRWKLLMEEYDYTVEFIKGRSNCVADCLSRPFNVNMMESSDEFTGFDDSELFPGFPAENNANNANDNANNNDEYDDIDINDLLRFHNNEAPPSVSESVLNDLDEQIGNNSIVNANIDNINENDVETGNENLVNNTNNDNDNDSLMTQHSQESSDDRIGIMDENSIINTEANQIVISRGKGKPQFKKIFNKNRIIFKYRDARDIGNNVEEIREYLKPDTVYGIVFSNKSPLFEALKTEILSSMTNEIVKIVPNIKFRIYKRINADITDVDEQTMIIARCHEDKNFHRGINENYKQIRKNYYWPAMHKDVTEFVNKCEICLKTKYERNPIKTKFKVTPTPTKPFEKLQIDTFTYNNIKILTIVDSFSKRLSAYTLKSANSIEIIKNLNNYLSVFPIPKCIQSDNGLEFNNALYKQFTEINGIETYFTTPYHPQSQGLIERTHSTIIEILQGLEIKFPKYSVEQKLRLALRTYNNSIKDQFNLSPNELTFGIQNYLPKNQDQDNPAVITEELANQYFKEIQALNDAVYKKIIEEKEKRTEKCNKNREEPPEIPDRIFIKNPKFHKNVPRYSTATKEGDRFKLKRNVIKIHPNRMKRPRKKVKDNLIVADEGNDHPSVVPDPSNVDVQTDRLDKDSRNNSD